MAKANGANRVSIRILGFARLVDALTNGLLITLIPFTLRPHPGLGEREFQIGLALSIGGLTSTLIQPLAGRQADRKGRMKAWIVWGITMTGLGMFLFTIHDDAMFYTVFRIVQGLGIGMSIPTALSMVAMLAESESVGASVGKYITYRMVGFLIGPPIGAWFFQQNQSRSGFLFGALAALISAWLIQLFVPDVHVHPHQGSKAVPARKNKPIPPTIYVLGVSQFIIGAGVSMFAPLAVHFRTVMNVSPLMFSAAFSSFLIARLLTQYLAGKAADRGNPRLLIRFGVFGTSVALLGLPLSSNGWMLLIGRALQGALSSWVTTPALAWVFHLAPEERLNEAMSYLTMGFGLGLSAGPVLAGTAVWLGSWRWSYILMGMMTMFVGLYLTIAHERSGSRFMDTDTEPPADSNVN